MLLCTVFLRQVFKTKMYVADMLYHVVAFVFVRVRVLGWHIHMGDEYSLLVCLLIIHILISVSELFLMLGYICNCK